jgi:hypothetical protein
MQYEININIEFNFGRMPIISSISAWLIPRKKISGVISETIQKDLDAYFLTRNLRDYSKHKLDTVIN